MTHPVSSAQTPPPPVEPQGPPPPVCFGLSGLAGRIEQSNQKKLDFVRDLLKRCEISEEAVARFFLTESRSGITLHLAHKTGEHQIIPIPQGQPITPIFQDALRFLTDKTSTPPTFSPPPPTKEEAEEEKAAASAEPATDSTGEPLSASTPPTRGPEECHLTKQLQKIHSQLPPVARQRLGAFIQQPTLIDHETDIATIVATHLLYQILAMDSKPHLQHLTQQNLHQLQEDIVIDIIAHRAIPTPLPSLDDLLAINQQMEASLKQELQKEMAEIKIALTNKLSEAELPPSLKNLSEELQRSPNLKRLIAIDGEITAAFEEMLREKTNGLITATQPLVPPTAPFTPPPIPLGQTRALLLAIPNTLLNQFYAHLNGVHGTLPAAIRANASLGILAAAFVPGTQLSALSQANAAILAEYKKYIDTELKDLPKEVKTQIQVMPDSTLQELQSKETAMATSLQTHLLNELLQFTSEEKAKLPMPSGFTTLEAELRGPLLILDRLKIILAPAVQIREARRRKHIIYIAMGAIALLGCVVYCKYFYGAVDTMPMPTISRALPATINQTAQAAAKAAQCAFSNITQSFS